MKGKADSGPAEQAEASQGRADCAEGAPFAKAIPTAGERGAQSQQGGEAGRERTDGEPVGNGKIEVGKERTAIGQGRLECPEPEGSNPRPCAPIGIDRGAVVQ